MLLRILLVFAVFPVVAQEGCTGLSTSQLILTILGSMFSALVSFLVEVLTGTTTT